MQIDIRITAREFITAEYPLETLMDFPLTPGEEKDLLKAIEKTLTKSTFFVYDADVQPEPGVPEYPRTFMVTISHIRSHD